LDPIEPYYEASSTMTEIDLSDKVPEMRPCNGPPSLFMINGCGLTVYGRRDYDSETGTYLKTHVFCLLFIPIIALRAYRVADAGNGGWFFIGKEPLSGLARLWNLLLVGGTLTAIGAVLVGKHFNSPDAVAQRKLARANELFEKREVQAAADLWEEVAGSGTKHAGEAKRRMKQAWDHTASEGSVEDAAVILPVAMRMADEGRWMGDQEDLYTAAVELANRRAKTDLRSAIEILNAVERLAPDEETCNADRRPLLESAVKEFPNAPEFASELAAMYEAAGSLDKCEAVLAPHADRLGAAEGARILGQILVSKGEFDRAHALLVPYVTERLDSLKQAEERYNNACTAAQQRAIDDLQQQRGPRSFYQKYDAAATDEEREALVGEYVFAQLRGDRDVADSQKRMAEQATVVSVALQLGMVMLRRAQDMSSPEARQKELENAEKVFLALAGVAGEADEYRLYMGQVKYWLGKHDEGRALFDELLTAHNRSSGMLLAVARMLRDVGVTSEARTLVEEADESSSDEQQRYAAAQLRALVRVDLDDEILWLGRCAPSDMNAKASLATAQGHRAIREGRDDDAARHLREGIALYGKQTENSSALNNAALAYFSLHQVTGDKAEFNRGVEYVERAVALEPSSSILLFNAASVVLEAVALDLVSSKIDVGRLKFPAELGMLSYLHNDDAGQRAVIEQLVKHPRTEKALEYLDQAMLLAPKNATIAARAIAFHAVTRDAGRLRELLQRLDDVELDLADIIESSNRYYRGEKDDVRRQEIAAATGRLQAALGGINKAADPASFAVAAAEQANRRMRAAGFGDAAVDEDEIVQLAEAAVAAAASEATEDTLIDALLFRASRRLADEHAEYAQMLEKGRRSVGHSYLVIVTVWRGGPLRDAVQANPDVQRVMSRFIERRRRYPDYRGVRAWALLQHAHPEEAQKVADAVRADEASQLTRALAFSLAPTSGTAAYELCWSRQILGKGEEALEPLRRCAELGTPLPHPVQFRAKD